MVPELGLRSAVAVLLHVCLLLASPQRAALQQRVEPQQPARTAAVTLSSASVFVGDTVVFTAQVNPPLDGQLFYQFFVNGKNVSGGWQDSATLAWVADAPGSHAVNVQVGQRVSAGRRGNLTEIRTVLSGGRTPFDVSAPAPAPAPTEPPPTPTVPVSLPDSTPGIASDVGVPVEQPLTIPPALSAAPVTPPPDKPDAPPVDVHTVVTVPTWVYFVAGAGLVLLGYLGVRLARPPNQKEHTPEPGPSPTLRPVPDRAPRFDPAKPPGISLQIRLVRNVPSLRFSPRVRIDRKE